LLVGLRRPARQRRVGGEKQGAAGLAIGVRRALGLHGLAGCTARGHTHGLQRCGHTAWFGLCRAHGFDLSIKAHQTLNMAVALGCGSEMAPSLVKAQAHLNQVKIGPA